MTNKVICGDNLQTLDKVPNGSIKLAYLDPPYNTLGSQNKYNDSFRSHQEWLSMLEPRLVKVCSKLRPDGVVAVSIDDVEQAHLRILMDRLFGEQNFLANLIWVKPGLQQTTKTFIKKHEHIIVFCKDRKKLQMNRRVLEVKDDKRYKYTDEKETFWIMPDGKVSFTKPITFIQEVSNNKNLYEGSIVSYNRKSNNEPIEITGNSNRLHSLSNTPRNDTSIIGSQDPIAVSDNGYFEGTAQLSKTVAECCLTITKLDPIEIPDNSYMIQHAGQSAPSYANGDDTPITITDNTWMDNRATKAASAEGNEKPIEISDNTHNHQTLDCTSPVAFQCGKNTNTAPVEIGNNTFREEQLQKNGARSGNNQDPLLPPIGTLIYPKTAWRWCKKKIQWAQQNNLVGYRKNKDGKWVAFFKQYKYLTTERDKQGNYSLVPITRSSPYETVITDVGPDRTMSKLFGSKNTFHYSKPVSLMKKLLDFFTLPGDLVLDVFAGSGTMNQACYEHNRSCIGLQSNENNIFQDVLLVRLNSTIGSNFTIEGFDGQ